ncbi:MAG: nitrogen fixation protein NifS, partial [Alphaproteobacteria bacterium]|nr:nitrogen fixation protein NifS [Alphaproteobacteria bacterium]
MIEEIPGLMDEVRSRFAHVDRCPYGGERVFLENAGGALTLNAVVETSARHAAIPDNQGRDNPASAALVAAIARGKADMMDFFGAAEGDVFVGESGTELLFRLISNAILETAPGGRVVGSTLEHPASRSASTRWSKIAGKELVLAAHDVARGTVTAADY